MEKDKTAGSRMVRDDQPTPRPSPPSLGGDVDAEHFNRRWQAEVDRAQALDPFDAVDAKAQGLQTAFHQQADVVGEAQSRLSQSEDELAGAIDNFLEATEQDRTPPPELHAHIERLQFDNANDEARLNALTHNAQALEPELDLLDAFDRVDASADRASSIGRGKM